MCTQLVEISIEILKKELEQMLKEKLRIEDEILKKKEKMDEKSSQYICYIEEIKGLNEAIRKMNNKKQNEIDKMKRLYRGSHKLSKNRQEKRATTMLKKALSSEEKERELNQKVTALIRESRELLVKLNLTDKEMKNMSVEYKGMKQKMNGIKYKIDRAKSSIKMLSSENIDYGFRQKRAKTVIRSSVNLQENSKSVKMKIDSGKDLHIYYGGYGCSDGEGHGHIVLNNNEGIVFVRTPRIVTPL